MKKKLLISAMLMLSMAICLAACGQSQGEDKGAKTKPNQSLDRQITDFVAGEPEDHETILPWKFEDGEEVENAYYKRTIDGDGMPVYAVLKASNEQVAYLPMGSTVVYTGNSENCYYEKVTNTYKLDGEDIETVQYQMHVTAIAPESQMSTEEVPVSGEGEGSIAEQAPAGVTIESETVKGAVEQSE